MAGEYLASAPTMTPDMTRELQAQNPGQYIVSCRNWQMDTLVAAYEASRAAFGGGPEAAEAQEALRKHFANKHFSMGWKPSTTHD